MSVGLLEKNVRYLKFVRNENNFNPSYCICSAWKSNYCAVYTAFILDF